MHQPSQISSPLFQSNSRIPHIFQPATHQSIVETVCHRIGYGARLASSESPQSERETAMDVYLVVVVETRKHERRRRCELLSIPYRYRHHQWIHPGIPIPSQIADVKIPNAMETATCPYPFHAAIAHHSASPDPYLRPKCRMPAKQPSQQAKVWQWNKD